MPGVIRHDLRIAGRSLRKRPGFALTCIAVLAIGLGAVTVMFTTLNGVVLQPLPFPDSERLVWAWAVTDRGNDNSISALDYFDYRDRCSSFSSLAAQLVWRPGMVITGGDEPVRVVTSTVSPNLFRTLGVAPVLGRSFTAAEEAVDGPRAVVVSHRFFERHLSGDRARLGTPITVDGAPFEVVGIMPERFDYPAGVDLWFPMHPGGRAESGRGNNNFRVFGRLADGATLATAEAEMRLVAAQIAKAYPDTNEGWSVRLTSLHEVFFGEVRPLMLMLTGATFLLLLIACANLSALLLAKVTSRRSEFALRLSLGASSWAIARQVLVESLTLAAAGAVLGLGLALAGLKALKLLGPPNLPRLAEVGLDLPALAVTLAATVLTGLLFGLAPALQGSRVDLVAQLKAARNSTEAGGRLRLRGIMVAAQTALSLVLLVASELLVTSSMRLQRVDPGFDVQGLLTVTTQLPEFKYASARELEQATRDIVERVRAVPGAVNAAVADQLPPFGGFWNGVHRPDRPPRTPADSVPAVRRMVGEGYFETLQQPIQRGRAFTSEDRLEGHPVTVISRALADALYPGVDPLGQFVVLPWGDGIHLEIVGVAGNVKDYGLAADSRPVFYLPISQYPQDSFRIVVRSAGDPTALAGAARQAVGEVEKDAPVFGVGTMEGWFADTLAGPNFTAFLLSAFSVVALILAGTGLYGVMAFFVAERAREIGIRVALGASPSKVLGWVLGKGTVMAASGVAVGLVAAAGAARLIESLLFATRATDVTAYVVAAAVLVVVTFAACALPARRALANDPTAVMRAE